MLKTKDVPAHCPSNISWETLMTRLADNKTAVAVIAGLSLVGALAGCAPTEAESTPAETAEPTTEATTAPEASTDDSTSTYVDGTYTESGNYQSPNGTETVDVTVTMCLRTASRRTTATGRAWCMCLRVAASMVAEARRTTAVTQLAVSFMIAVW